MAESFAQAGFQGVIGGVCDAGNQAGRSIGAFARRIGERASGIQAALVNIIFARLSGNKDCGIALDEAWQMGPFGSHVADFKQDVRAKRSLDVQVPVLRIG